MKIIKDISAMIEDELNGAEEYIKEAIRVKDEYPDISDMFYKHAKDEMGHMDDLHNAIVKLIKAYRETEGDPPPAMQAFYDYLHEAHMERAARIQWYLKKYTE